MKKEFTKRYEKLLKVKDTTTAKIGRGQDFEVLINDVLEDENLLIKRGYHTSDNKSEQIDGAIEIQNRIILLEVKWVKKNIAASELYAFIGKTESKLVGTLGLFISKEKLSDNFINAIVKGRKRNILLIHGEDIDLIFNEDVCIKDYLEYCIKRYSYDNLLHFSVAKWIDEKKTISKAQQTNQEIDQIDKDVVKGFLKTIIVNKSVPEHEISLDIEDLKEAEKIKIAEFLLQKYSTYYTAYSESFSDNRHKFINIEKALKHLLSSKKITRKIYPIYFQLYTNNPESSRLKEYLWESFKKYHDKLESVDRVNFEKALVENFRSIFDSWTDENRLTNVVEYIWSSIEKTTRQDFLSLYIEIYFSDRRDTFEQKQFASKIIEDPSQVQFIRKWIKEKILEEIGANDLKSNDIESEVRYFNRYYSKARHLLSYEPNKWVEYISKIYTQNINK